MTLVSLNVRHVAAGELASAFVTGSLISVTWWYNARTSARSRVRFGGLAYGLGAGTGTVLGIVLSNIL